jgi:voltage-gated potassium channel Kch
MSFRLSASLKSAESERPVNLAIGWRQVAIVLPPMSRDSLLDRLDKVFGIEHAMSDVKLWVYFLVTAFITVGLISPIAIAEGKLTSRGALLSSGILALIACGAGFYVVQKIYRQTAAVRKGPLVIVAALSYALIIWLFAGLYILISTIDRKAFYHAVTTSYGAVDLGTAVYFSVVTISTVGYGDIVPVSPLARWIVIAEIVIGIVYAIYVFSALLTVLLSQEIGRNVPPSPPVI